MKRKYKQSLRIQTIGTCVFLVFLSFSITAAGILSRETRDTHKQLIETMNVTADKKALELDFSMLSIEKAVFCAKDYILHTLDENRILRDSAYEKEYMASLSTEMISLTRVAQDAVSLYFRMDVERFGGTRGIFLEGDTKRGFVSVQPTDILLYSPTDMEHVGWYYLPLWKKAPIWTPPYINKNLDINMISFVIPIFKENRFLGIVGMDINLARIKLIVDDLPAENTLGLLLSDEDGLIYFNSAHLSENPDLVMQSAKIDEILNIFKNSVAGELSTFSWNDKVHYGIKRTLKNNMTFIFAVSETAILNARYKMYIPIAVIFFIVICFMMLAIWLVLKNIFKPIRIITETTFKIARGELNTTIPYKSKNEIGTIADNIRMMTTQMKEYITHISEQAKKERAAKEEALTQSKSKSEFLASMYLSLHEIDFENDSFAEIHSRGDIRDAIGRTIGEVTKKLPEIMSQLSNESSWNTLLPFVDLSTINERMKGKNTIAQEFLGAGGKWCRGRFIAMDRKPDGTLCHALWAVEYIDEERAERERLRNEADKERAEKEAAISQSKSKSEFLASIYLSLHEIDLNTDSFTEIQVHSDVAKSIGSSMSNARATVRRVMEERIQNTGKEREDFMEFINFDTLEERMKDRKSIAQEFLGGLGYWCRARFILVDRNPDGTLHHVLWAVENIAEERALREKLQDEAQRQAAASQAKSAFLANMSHEIRTPINAVLGMDEMILREAEDKTILGYAANIRTAGTNLLSIVNDILDFSKIEAGKMEIIPENYDISSVVVDLVNMIHERVKSKNLEFILQTEPTLPKTLFGDSIRIKQCILNLLTNAVKYTHKGSITFTLGFTKISEQNISLSVSVKDTGIGIKEEDMQKLFSPFERIEEGRNKTIEGSGLGMSIVMKMLDMMGSRLDVKSVYGEGSEFSFSIEQKVIDWTEVGDINEAYEKSVEQISAYKEKLHAQKAHLLFVDDTEMNLEVIKGLLKKTKIKLDMVLSGKEALEKVKQNSYDILFIDHRMPEMDGIQTLHAMQTMEGNKSAGKPCIALTANALSGVRKMYIDEGFTDYLSKPVNPAKLEEMIRQYLPPEYIEKTGEEDDDTENESSGEENGFLAKFKETEGIEIETALQNCGTAELLESTVKKYYESIEEKSGELQKYFEEENWEDYCTKVHALKSTSRLIGAMEVSKMAAELEELSEKKQTEEIQEKHAPLMEKYKEFKEKFKILIPNEDSAASDKTEISESELNEKLSKLGECADSFDIDGLDSIMAELSDFAMPSSFAEKFTKIRTAVENVDFKALKNLLEN